MASRLEELGNRSGHIGELDGLRAVSVVLVMSVHAPYGRLSGGFLGVDVFFVLSGYLITSILVRERRARGDGQSPQLKLRNSTFLGLVRMDNL